MLLLPSSLLLETRGRWQIPNYLRPERAEAALRASVSLLGGQFPRAQLRSITAVYNCVGLVVASRRTWVDPEHLIRILREDGYRQLPGVAEVQPGDVVVYRDSDGQVCHVGFVVERNLIVLGERSDPLKVLSKWGADGEYIHDSLDLPPLLGTPTDYWTDRRLP